MAKLNSKKFIICIVFILFVGCDSTTSFYLFNNTKNEIRYFVEIQSSQPIEGRVEPEKKAHINFLGLGRRAVSYEEFKKIHPVIFIYDKDNKLIKTLDDFLNTDYKVEKHGVSLSYILYVNP